MVRLAKLLLFLLLVLLMTTTELAAAPYRGYLERAYGDSTCMAESHYLTDWCKGYPLFLTESQTLPLDPYLCSYVVLDGPDMGGVDGCVLLIQPASVAPASPPCTDQVQLSLTQEMGIVRWSRAPCNATYDLIKGEISAVTPGPSQIDLGTVSCLANDVAQPLHSWDVIGPEDPEIPPVGSVYFYLVRPRGPVLPETYGASSDNRERVPFSGDCFF